MSYRLNRVGSPALAGPGDYHIEVPSISDRWSTTSQNKIGIINVSPGTSYDVVKMRTETLTGFGAQNRYCFGMTLTIDSDTESEIIEYSVNGRFKASTSAIFCTPICSEVDALGASPGDQVDMDDYCALPSTQTVYGTSHTTVSAQGTFSYKKSVTSKYIVLGVLFGAQSSASVDNWEFTLGMRRWVANADDYPDYGDPKVQG
jgi:hypothetical protein